MKLPPLIVTAAITVFTAACWGFGIWLTLWLLRIYMTSICGSPA